MMTCHLSSRIQASLCLAALTQTRRAAEKHQQLLNSFGRWACSPVWPFYDIAQPLVTRSSFNNHSGAARSGALDFKFSCGRLLAVCLHPSRNFPKQRKGKEVKKSE